MLLRFTVLKLDLQAISCTSDKPSFPCLWLSFWKLKFWFIQKSIQFTIKRPPRSLGFPASSWNYLCRATPAFCEMRGWHGDCLALRRCLRTQRRCGVTWTLGASQVCSHSEHLKRGVHVWDLTLLFWVEKFQDLDISQINVPKSAVLTWEITSLILKKYQSNSFAFGVVFISVTLELRK